MNIQKEEFLEWVKSENPLLVDEAESGSQFHKDILDYMFMGWVAKAQKVAVPDGYVLVEKSKLESFYQDDDEPENFCSNINEIDVLSENLDLGEIMVINKITSAYVSNEKLYGVLVACKKVAPYFNETTLKVFNNYDDAHKAMIKAQEKKIPDFSGTITAKPDLSDITQEQAG